METKTSEIRCKNCNMKCNWIKSKKGKWYLTPIAMDGKIYKVHGMNGMFYPIHQCRIELKEVKI